MSGSIGNRYLKKLQALDEALVALPFSFITRATAVPDTIKGAIILSVAGTSSLVRTSAGLFTFSITDQPFEVVGAAVCCTSGAAENIVPHIDASLATTTGVVTVRTMTTTTPTDPATGATIYGVLYVRYTDRVMTK